MTAHDNLRFLTSEVASQVSTLHALLESSSQSASLAQRILDRAGYSTNLQRRIHEYCLRQMDQPRESGSNTVAARSMQSIASELERIAALCRECVIEIGRMQQRDRLRAKHYAPMLERVIAAIGRIDSAVAGRDTELALRIGQAEARLDKGYRRLMTRYTHDLGRQQGREDIIHALFVVRCVKHMGDALRVISEAVISANLGQPFDTGRYHSLTAAVESLKGQDSDTLSVENVAETRSGSAITGITDGDDERVAIFKEGLKRKVKEERQGVESWHQVYPGVAPRILSYQKRGRSAALLIEHLAGLTFERILLHESRGLLGEALHRLTRTLKSVWKETRTREPVSAGFMTQLASRIGDVYALHSHFRQPRTSIAGLQLPAFDALVQQAAALEADIKVPFSVYIHGDFNLDNIIYDPEERHINFIDLHRSQYMDYVQDVSVFMVSCYRLQVLDPRRRRRAMALILAFYRFAARRARKEGDHSFELRLALGLARSFVTSTRFILDPTLARAMFLRGRYLLELALQADPKRPKGFRIPMEDIFVG